MHKKLFRNSMAFMKLEVNVQNKFENKYIYRRLSLKTGSLSEITAAII